MDNSSSSTAWIVAAVVVVVLAIGIALWYSSSSTSPGLPNTGTPNQTDMSVPADGGAIPADGSAAY
ncbi:MAG: hypothetical protein WC050_03240 [Candidatus Paceibacterota bacterium]